MEGISVTVYKGLKGYCRRRGYVKLDGSGGSRRSKVVLGSTTRRRRRFWRIKVKPKLRLLPSPKELFARLRDAYVKMMLRIANYRVVNTVYGGAIGGGGNVSVFEKGSVKEYEERVTLEIYKTLAMAHGQVVPRSAGKFGLIY